MKNTNNNLLEKYLVEVERYLTYLPVSEKTDILSELKNSFYERLESGQTDVEIINQMEDPKTFAASYIGDAIAKSDKFSRKTFMQVMGFYSVASMTWMIVIPVLALLAVSFFFSSGVSVLAGILGLVKGIVHIPLIDNMKFVFFVYELEGILALAIGLLLAILFLWIGILFWKLTTAIIRIVHRKNLSLKYKL